MAHQEAKSAREELEEEWVRLNKERSSIGLERTAILADKAGITNREKKLNSMFMELDERESKLKMHIDFLEDQKDQWLRSANDLLRRETVIEDWQKNHSAREKKLQELDAEQEKRFALLLEREVVVTDGEQGLKVKEVEFQELERKAEQNMARVKETESGFTARDEKLVNLEG